MDGRGRLQIEHEYQRTRGVYMSPRSASEFPEGSVPAVRRAVLEKFIAQLAAVTRVQSQDVLEKPLGERERATLLTMIAALANLRGS